MPLLDFREELAAGGRIIGAMAKGRGLAGLRSWAESPPSGMDRPLLVWICRLLPLATAPLVLLYLLELLSQADLGSPPPWAPPGALAVGLLLAQILLGLSYRMRTHRTFHEASSGEAGLGDYWSLFRTVSAAPLESPALVRMQAALQADGKPAHVHFSRLKQLLEISDARLSMFHPFLDALFLWDLHVWFGLERWKRRFGRQVGPWLDALGRVDALSALAACAHDHPDWVMPVVSEESVSVIRGRSLGHPLIAPEKCVCNDVEVGPPGSFVLVTGSNMSGKSTLLRAVGVNVVLAQAGGVVCAREMEMPSLSLETNMGVSDSLAKGLSQFSAELHRLKEIQDSVEGSSEQGERPVLCLLDELLRGTNTVERRAGARRVIRRLLRHEAILMVTTHDLRLADSPDLAERSEPIHFDGSVERDQEGMHLSFDYRIRPGLATSTNAIALMDLMELGDKGAPASEPE